MTLTDIPIDSLALINNVDYNDENIEIMYKAMRLGVVPGIEFRKISQTGSAVELRCMDDNFVVALSTDITDNIYVDLLLDDDE